MSLFNYEDGDFELPEMLCPNCGSSDLDLSVRFVREQKNLHWKVEYSGVLYSVFSVSCMNCGRKTSMRATHNSDPAAGSQRKSVSDVGNRKEISL